MPPQSDSTLRFFSIVVSVAYFGYLVRLYLWARKTRPRFEPADVVFQERYASGCSEKNILTKLGGARNCLRLVVTQSVLWVTPSFPFSLIATFAPFYDLDHVIPLDSILSVRSSSFLGRRTFLLTYRDGAGDTHALRLLPKKPDDFIRSLGVRFANELPT